MADTRKRTSVSELLKAGSFLSTWTAGLFGALVVRYLGDSLAMGAQMWVAMNTEPVQPRLDFPIVATTFAAILPVPLAAKRRWSGAMLASLPFFALPWWHFSRLYALAQGGG